MTKCAFWEMILGTRWKEWIDGWIENQLLLFLLYETGPSWLNCSNSPSVPQSAIRA